MARQAPSRANQRSIAVVVAVEAGGSDMDALRGNLTDDRRPATAEIRRDIARPGNAKVFMQPAFPLRVRLILRHRLFVFHADLHPNLG